MKKVIEICDERITQLENHIISLGGTIPPAVSPRSEELLSELRAGPIQSPGKIHEAPNQGHTTTLMSSASNLNDDSFPGQAISNSSDAHEFPMLNPNNELRISVDDSSPQWPSTVSQINAVTDVDFEMPFIENFDVLDIDGVDWPWDTTGDDPFYQPLPMYPHHFPEQPMGIPDMLSDDARPHPVDSTEDEVLTDTESDSEIVEQISNRYGYLNIIDDGSASYLGVTSNMTLARDWTTHAMRTKTRTASTQSKDLSPIPNLDDQLYNHLLRLYFHWQNPFMPVVDRNVFLDATAQVEKGKPSTFYSDALKYAM